MLLNNWVRFFVWQSLKWSSLNLARNTCQQYLFLVEFRSYPNIENGVLIIVQGFVFNFENYVQKAQQQYKFPTKNFYVNYDVAIITRYTSDLIVGHILISFWNQFLFYSSAIDNRHWHDEKRTSKQIKISVWIAWESSPKERIFKSSAARFSSDCWAEAL